ncbi:MAG TPA: hypothetical protein VFF52_00520 [Isosphaeraceae bacterium]|nr:hypothetical protein [Isosphaeraceae bacterium]
MKPKSDYDPELPSNVRPWYWRIRAIGQLVVVIVLSGLLFSAIPSRGQGPVRSALRFQKVPGQQAVIPGPIGRLRTPVRPPRDRFVIVAPAAIDPKMVVRADPDLDAEMVFNPETGRRGSSGSAPARAGVPVAPPAVPHPAPAEPPPQTWTPPPSVVPQPQPH